jgi:hypothetical protein
VRDEGLAFPRVFRFSSHLPYGIVDLNDTYSRTTIIVISTQENHTLLAHTNVENISARGEIEPLVGREWKVANQAGEEVTYSGLCWTPGSVVDRSPDFTINERGIWQTLN